MDMVVNTEVLTRKPLFELNNSGDLLFKSSATETIKVTTSLCFPWMKKSEFISIRDEQGNEVFMIEQLSSLDEISFCAVAESLIAASFMMNILNIKDIKSEFEIRTWTVVTKQGLYKFQTQIDYWPQIINNATILIRDITGNIFYINDLLTLDDKSQHLLWPYVD